MSLNVQDNFYEIQNNTTSPSYVFSDIVKIREEYLWSVMVPYNNDDIKFTFQIEGNETVKVLDIGLPLVSQGNEMRFLRPIFSSGNVYTSSVQASDSIDLTILSPSSSMSLIMIDNSHPLFQGRPLESYMGSNEGVFRDHTNTVRHIYDTMIAYNLSYTPNPGLLLSIEKWSKVFIVQETHLVFVPKKLSSIVFVAKLRDSVVEKLPFRIDTTLNTLNEITLELTAINITNGSYVNNIETILSSSTSTYDNLSYEYLDNVLEDVIDTVSMTSVQYKSGNVFSLPYDLPYAMSMGSASYTAFDIFGDQVSELGNIPGKFIDSLLIEDDSNQDAFLIAIPSNINKLLFARYVQGTNVVIDDPGAIDLVDLSFPPGFTPDASQPRWFSKMVVINSTTDYNDTIKKSGSITGNLGEVIQILCVPDKAPLPLLIEIKLGADSSFTNMLSDTSLLINKFRANWTWLTFTNDFNELGTEIFTDFKISEKKFSDMVEFDVGGVKSFVLVPYSFPVPVVIGSNFQNYSYTEDQRMRIYSGKYSSAVIFRELTPLATYLTKTGLMLPGYYDNISSISNCTNPDPNVCKLDSCVVSGFGTDLCQSFVFEQLNDINNSQIRREVIQHCNAIGWDDSENGGICSQIINNPSVLQADNGDGITTFESQVANACNISYDPDNNKYGWTNENCPQFALNIFNDTGVNKYKTDIQNWCDANYVYKTQEEIALMTEMERENYERIARTCACWSNEAFDADVRDPINEVCGAAGNQCTNTFSNMTAHCFYNKCYDNITMQQLKRDGGEECPPNTVQICAQELNIAGTIGNCLSASCSLASGVTKGADGNDIVCGSGGGVDPPVVDPPSDDDDEPLSPLMIGAGALAITIVIATGAFFVTQRGNKNK